jgi:hypothetical protein
MIRSLRSVSFLLPYSPSIIPTMRHFNSHPGNTVSPISTRTSTGSPSAAVVDRTNLISYGNIIPAGKT